MRMLILLASLTFNTGCFYLVSHGEGGVAERFTYQMAEYGFDKRYAKCAERRLAQERAGLVEAYPAHYADIDNHLRQSVRYQAADLHNLADRTLRRAELLLDAYNSAQLSKAQLCAQTPQGGICL